jgi:mannose-6-phosphate isomerase-like protein (cupin superfamily)
MSRSAPIALATLTLLVAALAGAGAAQHPAPPAVLDAWLGERLTVDLAALPGRAPLADDQTFRVVELGRDAHTSHHIVAIRDGELPHRHDQHDLLVVMLRGHGTMRLGSELQPVGEGSILYVPRGSVHAFSNASGGIAYAYAVYSPAFDGADRVLVE